MCRWLAYSGTPILLEELLYKPEYSLIDQSMHSRMGVETTNGDGFGVGWYGVATRRARPTRSRVPVCSVGSVPAWGDVNLRELARNISSGLFLAHIRRQHRHAGAADELPPVPSRAVAVGPQRRDPRLRAPQARPGAGRRPGALPVHRRVDRLGGDVPPRADLRAPGGPGGRRSSGWSASSRRPARRHGVDDPLQMTVATSDGERLWAFRYSSSRQSRTLYVSTAVAALRELYPDNPAFRAALRRDPHRGVRAARRPRRRLEPGARVELRHRREGETTPRRLPPPAALSPARAQRRRTAGLRAWTSLAASPCSWPRRSPRSAAPGWSGRGCASSAAGCRSGSGSSRSGSAGSGAAVVALGIYGFVATLQPDAHFGRILAAYGGVFVAGSLAWGMVVDGFRPDRCDLTGALLCLAGVAVIMYAPRTT